MKLTLAMCVLALAAWTSGAAAGTESAAPGIVVSADLAPSLSGEIYRIDRDGRRTDLSRSPFQDTQPLVSPDGRTVAFVSDRTGRPAVYAVGVDGSGLRRISSALAQPRLLGWSPDGRDILTSVGLSPTTQLFVVGLDHPQRAIVGPSDACGANQAGWSPDGRAIAFTGCTNGVGSVRVVTPSGAPLFSVPSASRRTFFFWSPAGEIAIRSDRTIRLFDSRGLPLARFGGDALAWSGSGDRVASMTGGRLEVRSASGRESFHAQLFPEGEVRAIIKRVGSYDPELLWMAPDRVAVANVQLSDQLVGPIGASPGATVSAGTDLATGRRWKPGQAAWDAAACACESPGDRQIATTVRSGTGFALQLSNPGGGDARTLAHLPGCSNDGVVTAIAAGLQFAAGGRSLVYATYCSEPPANLFRVPGAGATAERLTHTGAQQTDPAVSPDGSRIAFTQADAVGMSCKGCPAGIWSMNADGTGAHELTGPQDSTWDTSPSWSPDGKQIVFSRSTISSFGRLYAVAAAGGEPRDLRAAGASPAWGPRLIAWIGDTAIGGSHLTLRTMRPDGSHRRKLATGVLASPAWSNGGALAYLAGSRPQHAVVIDGAVTRRIPLPFAGVASIAWAADGRHLLVVARALATSPLDAYSLPVKGGAPVRLTSNLDVLGATPAG